MSTQHLREMAALLFRLVFLVLISGCPADSSRLADGGSSGTGITSGTISGFGSIFSGGVEYDTTNATLLFDDSPGIESQFDTGMVVTVIGSVDEDGKIGNADRVEFTFKLIGLVDPKDPNQPPDSIDAVGQRLNFNSRTTYRNTTLADLAAGDPIAVSGFTDSTNEILVTYIEKLTASPETSVIGGVINQLDISAGVFMLGKQRVDFNSATLTGMPDEVLQNGLRVRVEGVEKSTSGQSRSVIIAQEISAAVTPLTTTLADTVRVEGLVNIVLSAAEFTINTIPAMTSQLTEYINGSQTDIVLDARAQVLGKFDSEGVLQISTVRFIKPADIVIEGNVDSVNIPALTLDILGRDVALDNFTVMTDSSSAGLRQFTIADISVGNRVIVDGIDNGTFIQAGKVERIDSLADNTLGSLQGEVDLSINDPTFSIAGRLINTAGLVDQQDFMKGSFPITRNGFFTSITPGMEVRATGTLAGGQFTPTRVSIVNCCNWLVYAVSVDGSLFAGANDAVFNWDGTSNTSELSTNVNASLSTSTPILGFAWTTSDMRIFGPGAYVFDTGLIDEQSTGFGTVNLGGIPLPLTVGPNQLGAHVLFHWGAVAPTSCGRFLCNADVVFLWDVNGVFPGSPGSGDALGAKNKLFNFASVDGDGDGVPGIAIVAGPFAGISNAYNLNYTPQ